MKTTRSLPTISVVVAAGFLGACFIFGVTSNIQAQGFQWPAPEESFKRMDQNGNGQIDPEEFQRLPSGFRDFYARQGIDISRPVSLQQFVDSSQKMREQFEQARNSGGGFSGRRSGGEGGPPGAMQGPPPGGDAGRGSSGRPEDNAGRDGRREENSDGRKRDDDANSKGSGSSSSRSAKDKKPKTKITKELPDDYRLKDKNGDGQIGLYEWERKLFAQFYELDRNSDGFLTADEVIPPASKSKSSKPKGPSYKLPSSTATSATSRTETAKTLDVPKTSPAAEAKPATTDNPQAVSTFTSLDVNKDGKISQDEWDRARTARRMFERANITVTLPIKQAQFLELYGKVPPN